MNNLNLLPGFVASLTGLVLGYLWYSVLFTKEWQKLAGLTKVQATKVDPKRIIGSYLLTLVMSLNLAMFIGSNATPTFGLMAGFVAGFGWVALALGNNYLFEHRPFKLLLINGGYNIVLFSIMGLIIGSL